MKSDRELLELAAKAAGIDGEYDARELAFYIHGATGKSNWDPVPNWDPLNNDGDALRLAVTLGLQLFCVTGWVNDKHGQALFEIDGFEFNNIRRAIVNAAALLCASDSKNLDHNW